MRLYCCVIALLLMACAHGKSTGTFGLRRDDHTCHAYRYVCGSAAGYGRSTRRSLALAPRYRKPRSWADPTGHKRPSTRLEDILADLDEHDALVDTAQAATLESAIEQAYLDLLPHLKDFPDNSRLLLLSEEKIEHLPADAKLSVRIRQLRARCDMPIDDNDRVVAKLRFFQTRGRKTFATWFAARRALPHAESAISFGARGCPATFSYVAVIESGLNPRAYSRSRAVGLWQFMARPGRMMDLKLTHWGRRAARPDQGRPRKLPAT